MEAPPWPARLCAMPMLSMPTSPLTGEHERAWVLAQDCNGGCCKFILLCTENDASFIWPCGPSWRMPCCWRPVGLRVRGLFLLPRLLRAHPTLRQCGPAQHPLCQASGHEMPRACACDQGRGLTVVVCLQRQVREHACQRPGQPFEALQVLDLVRPELHALWNDTRLGTSMSGVTGHKGRRAVAMPAQQPRQRFARSLRFVFECPALRCSSMPRFSPCSSSFPPSYKPFSLPFPSS